MESNREYDEYKIEQAPEQTDVKEMPQGWQPSIETTNLIEGADTEVIALSPERQELHKSAEVLPEKEPDTGFRPATDSIVMAEDIKDESQNIPEVNGDPELEQKSESQADVILDRMMENKGEVDLTKSGAWGRFAHASIQDELQSADSSVEAEKNVDVINADGTIGRGRIDVFSDNTILEIKTHDLDQFSDQQLAHKLNEFATQIEKYQWSPSLEGKPDANIFFEFPPKDLDRQKDIETFFDRRGIKVIWGND